jgi:thymidylate kinase
VTARGKRVGERRSFIYRSLWRLIAARKQPVPVLLDGGLVRRAHGVDALKSDICIEDYYRLMPVADLTVFLVADLDIVQERNIQRGGDHDRSAEAWRAMELDVIARRVFRERGARFVVLDAALSPEENSRRLPCMIPESF